MTKLNLVNPLNPNEIIKTEDISKNNNDNFNNQPVYENNNQEQLNNNLINDYNKEQININLNNFDTNSMNQNDNVDNASLTNDNENKKVKKKKNFISTLIIILSLIVIIVSWTIFFMQKHNESINKPTNEKNYISYEFDLKEYNDVFTTKINNDYTLRLMFDQQSYAIYINDLFILNDSNMGKIKFYMVDGNLIYINNVTDVRSETIYVIDKNSNVTQIYELDNILGMVPSEIDFKNDSIIIKATRLSHNYSIIHNNNIFDALLYDNKTWEQYGITENTIIQATYTYKFENGNLNLQPIVTNEVSIKDYLQNNM